MAPICYDPARADVAEVLPPDNLPRFWPITTPSPLGNWGGTNYRLHPRDNPLDLLARIVRQSLPSTVITLQPNADS
jgi:hypothetical protein